MLIHLTISNFALVRELDLTFSRAMTVVTGETGAGKSIMLDALALTLGDRADTNLIAQGENKAEIHSSFDLCGLDEPVSWLRERSLLDVPEPNAEDDKNQIVILRRVISKDGRSRGFINGVPSTMSDMRTLGNMLIDIHSQHEHQSLLKKDHHRRLLDEYGNLGEMATKVQTIFISHQACEAALKKILEDSQEQSSRLQLLTYQANELNELDLQPGELERLEAEQRQLANAEATIQSCQEAMALCGSDTDTMASISRAIGLVRTIEDTQLEPIIELLSSGMIQIEEAARDLQDYTQRQDVDPARLAMVEQRLNTIYEIARKHHIQADQLANFTRQLSQELAAIQHVDQDIDQLNRDKENYRSQYRKAATKLGKARQKAAASLEKGVSKKLADLGMAGATFEVSLCPLSDVEISVNGLEEIEFKVSTNPGQKAGSLNKIASGGELSRISLAIQVVTANTSNTPTLVFDEVDVGIGGATAEVVGNLLRGLGDQAQIICVTHLPQVAAQGHQHLLVAKSGDKRGTSVEVRELNETEKVEEIARMLGGIEMTDQSLAHAREMFISAQS